MGTSHGKGTCPEQADNVYLGCRQTAFVQNTEQKGMHVLWQPSSQPFTFVKQHTK